MIGVRGRGPGIAKRSGLAAVIWTAAAVIEIASAQPAPDAATAGKLLAQQLCVECHVIEPTGKGSWTDAPSFPTIANRSGVTVAGLSATIQKPHMHMLNDERPKEQADRLAAYIVSLRKR